MSLITNRIRIKHQRHTARDQSEHSLKVVEKRPYSVLKQEALGILGRAPERSSLSSVVSSSRRGSINQRIGNPVMERVLNSSPRFNR